MNTNKEYSSIYNEYYRCIQTGHVYKVVEVTKPPKKRNPKLRQLTIT